jgi:hypothetical protein
MSFKNREVDAALAVRPLETTMREAIRESCKRTAHEVEEPLKIEIKDTRRKLEILDGELFRLKNT